MLVTLLPRHNAIAWPPLHNVAKGTDEWNKHCLANTKPVWSTDLYGALTREYKGDVYFVGYAPTPVKRRLNRNILSHPEALEAIGGSVQMILFLMDIDNHEAEENESEEDRFSRVEDWWQDERLKVQECLAAHPGIVAYRSRNGFKLIGVLPEVFHIRCKEDAEQWSRTYTAWTNYLADKFDIKSAGATTADNLADWQRLQRVPNDGNMSPLLQGRHELLGDPSNVGMWQPTFEDKHWPTKREPKVIRQDANSDGGCLLLQLILNRGTRCEIVDGSAGNYDIECPDYLRHSPQNGKKDYFSKTRLLAGSSIGSILCQSGGCLHRANDPTSWLPFFSDQEIDEAEVALGRALPCGPPAEIKELPKDLAPRVSFIINQGIPRTDALDDFFSSDIERDKNKKNSQWIHEVMCGCLKEKMPYEQILGVFQHPWPLSSLGLSNRYLRFMLKNAVESVTLIDQPTVPELKSFYVWCVQHIPPLDPTTDVAKARYQEYLKK